jgi:hypothetical protein
MKITAHGSAADSASFYAMPSDNMNVFSAGPTQAIMRGSLSGYTNTTLGFGNNAAYGLGGFASLEGSGGDDFFISSYLGVQMFGPGYNNSAWNYRSVMANSDGGNDTARFYASPDGQDSFRRNTTGSDYYGTTFDRHVDQFRIIEAYAKPGAGSTAWIGGDAGDDHFVASPRGAQLWSAGYRVEAWNFASVVAAGNGGDDTADLYGAARDNKLAADCTTFGCAMAEFSGNGFSNQVQQFATVRVHGSTSGADSAVLDSVLLETGLNLQPISNPGVDIASKVWLYDFDQIATIKKPMNTTPEPHAVDKLMTAFMYQ